MFKMSVVVLPAAVRVIEICVLFGCEVAKMGVLMIAISASITNFVRRFDSIFFI